MGIFPWQHNHNIRVFAPWQHTRNIWVFAPWQHTHNIRVFAPLGDACRDGGVAGGEERVAAHKLFSQGAARASPVGCVQRVFATVRLSAGCLKWERATLCVVFRTFHLRRFSTFWRSVLWGGGGGELNQEIIFGYVWFLPTLQQQTNKQIFISIYTSFLACIRF